MSTVSTQEQERLRYPTGRNSLQPNPSVQNIHGWINELAALPGQMRGAVAGLSDTQLDTPYRPDGWTVRQVVHHVPDSHLNAYIRTHWALTEERPTIKPYDQDAWTALPYSRTAPIADSLDLLEALHARWVVVWRSLTSEQWSREYFHPEDQRYFTLADLLQTYAWHSRHHLAHITELRRRNNW
jgi:hypothetical protein